MKEQFPTPMQEIQITPHQEALGFNIKPLFELDWHEIKSEIPESEFDYYEVEQAFESRTPVIHNEKIMSLSRLYIEKDNPEVQTYQTKLFNENNEIIFEAELQTTVYKKNELELATSLQRFDCPEGVRLPKGFGLTFYNQMIQSIQNICNQRNKKITHFSSRYTSISKTPLSNKRWNEIFKPMLESWGYTEIKPGVWKKEYEPTQRSN